MNYKRKVARPEYFKLVDLFDQQFEKVEIQSTSLTYETILRLKIDLRFEMNINFPAKIFLLKDGILSNIKISINSGKIIFGSIFMFGLTTSISYIIHPSLYANLFGLFSGLFVYFMAKKQVEKELEEYLKKLLNKNKT